MASSRACTAPGGGGSGRIAARGSDRWSCAASRRRSARTMSARASNCAAVTAPERQPNDHRVVARLVLREGVGGAPAEVSTAWRGRALGVDAGRGRGRRRGGGDGEVEGVAAVGLHGGVLFFEHLARKRSGPSLRSTYLSRARCLLSRLPMRSKTRTAASHTSRSSPRGEIRGRRKAFCGEVERPPGDAHGKPRWPSRTRATRPDVVNRRERRVSRRIPQRNLELPRQAVGPPLRRKKRVMASPYGVTSNVPWSRTPASGSAVTLRTVLPQASRVVSPVVSSTRSAPSTSGIGTKWYWMFCRVVTWPYPWPQRAATSPRVRSCADESTPCGIFTRSIWAPSWRWP
jgi:hypothetical protein